MENYNSNSGGDKDDPPIDANVELDDDDEEQDSKSKQKRAPKRSLFFGGDKKDSEEDSSKKEESPKEEKRNLFSGLLKNEVKAEDENVTGETNDATDEASQTAQTENVDQSTISPTEEFQEVVSGRVDVVDRELAETSSLDKVPEATANAELLEAVSNNIEQGIEPEQAITDAVETVVDSGVIETSTDDRPESLPVDDSAEQLDDEEENIQQQPTPVVPLVIPPTPRTPNVPPTPPYQPPTPPRPPTPPLSPSPNLPPPPPSGPNAYQNYLNIPPQNPNTITNNPNIVPMNDTFYRDRRSGDVLLGGVLGFLYGKRRGRIKTERKLKPEITSRDETIGELTSKLTEAEARVRAEAAKIVAPIIIEKPVDRIIEKVVSEKELVGLEDRDVMASKEDVITTKVELEKQEAERAEILYQQVAELESDAKTNIIDALMPVPIPIPLFERSNIESEDVVRNEEVKTLPPVTNLEKIDEERAARKKIEQTLEYKKDPRDMSLPELLRVAEFINFEQVSLRQLYDRHRVDSANLRRIVIEFMHGGSRYEALLRGALEAYEIRSDLKREVYTEPDTSYAGSVGSTGSTGATSVSTILAGQVQNGLIAGVPSNADNVTDNTQVKSLMNETESDSVLLSNGTAIALGILMGVVLMILVLFYSDSI